VTDRSGKDQFQGVQQDTSIFSGRLLPGSNPSSSSLENRRVAASVE